MKATKYDTSWQIRNYIVRKEYGMDANKLLEFGFIKEENDLRLKEMISNKNKLKEVHIDIYPENPLTSSTSYMLLLHTSEKDVSILIDRDRLIFKKNDRYGTYFMNVLISKITECFSKISDNYSEFILNIQNIYYRITVLN
jgi:hypothetical protein